MSLVIITWFAVSIPSKPQFNNTELYIKGGRNFYINTTDFKSGTLVPIGCWLITHEDEINETQLYTHETILKKTTKTVLFYLHGTASNRIKPIQFYEQLRKHFLIIAVDHRGIVLV